MEILKAVRINGRAFAVLLAADNQHLWQGLQRILLRRFSSHSHSAQCAFCDFKLLQSLRQAKYSASYLSSSQFMLSAAGWDGLGDLCVGVGRETSPNFDAA